MSVLFADICGFTTISETKRPEEVSEFLSHFFSCAVDAIFAHGGTLDKFIGDAVMAVFGLAASREDDPESAVRAALEMRQALAELNQIAASRVQGDLLAALASSAERLGKLDRAIALERLRVAEEKRADEKATIEKRIAALLATLRAREAQAAALLRINKGNTTQTIYAARVL